MASLNNFDATQVEPLGDFEPIPADKYLAAIVESQMKPTKTGNGQFLELTFQILEGKYKGRKLWARLNLENPSQKAVQIARAELSAICRAVEILTPNDSVELHHLPMQIRVRCVRRKDTDEITNEIRGYSKREAAGGKPQQAETDDAPWKR